MAYVKSIDSLNDFLIERSILKQGLAISQTKVAGDSLQPEDFQTFLSIILKFYLNFLQIILGPQRLLGASRFYNDGWMKCLV